MSITTQTITEDATYTVSLQNYPAGTYYFTVILQNKEKQTVKVLKQ